VTALKSSGKAGKTLMLKYQVSDDSGRSAETIRVSRGSRILRTIKGALLPIMEGGKRSVRYNAKGQKRGKLRFCVKAADPTGNVSEESCEGLILK
jgi:hypothetical protein